jgi:hypothetical protein
MKRLLAALGFVFLFLADGGTAPTRAADTSDAGFKLMQSESLDGLTLGMKAASLVKLLGKPEKTGKEENWEAIGEWVQRWSWPKLGVTAQLSSKEKGGAKTLLTVTLTTPSERATRKGIRIGSTEAEVVKAYGALRDKETSEAGKTFVAGSPYGGLTFQFTKGKVSEIFLGAAAE